MPRVSLKLESKRSEDSAPRTQSYGVRVAFDLDWLRSERLQRNVLCGTCLLLVVLMFFFSLSSAIRLKMHSEVPYWVSAAVPPALSRVAYGHDKNYMSLNFVNDEFFGQLTSSYAKDVNRIIAEILARHPVATDKSDRVLSSDDKGIVVMTEISFRIFGYRIEGVLYLYYIILGLSAALYAYAYRRNPYALLLLAAFLLLHRMILPMVKYDAQLNGITALRCMPVLAMIACMHGILFSFESKVDAKKVGALVLQVAVIVFVIHTRSTTIWELVLVAGGSFLALLFRKGPVASGNSRLPILGARWPAGAPLVAAIVLLSVLSLHRAYGFPDEYRRDGETLTRPFWHNIYSGFAFHPGMAARYNLKVDDISVMLATKQFLLENNKADVWEATGGNTPDYKGMRWKAYDDAVKIMLLARCTEYFSECLSTFVYYKPLSMIKNLLWISGWRKHVPDVEMFVSKVPEIGTVVKEQFNDTTKQLDLHKERGRMWLRFMSAMAMAFALLAMVWGRKKELYPALYTAVILAAGSTVPSIVGYAAPHTIAEAAIGIPLSLAVLSACLVLYLVKSPKQNQCGELDEAPLQA